MKEVAESVKFLISDQPAGGRVSGWGHGGRHPNRCAAGASRHGRLCGRPTTSQGHGSVMPFTLRALRLWRQRLQHYQAIGLAFPPACSPPSPPRRPAPPSFGDPTFEAAADPVNADVAADKVLPDLRRRASPPAWTGCHRRFSNTPAPSLSCTPILVVNPLLKPLVTFFMHLPSSSTAPDWRGQRRWSQSSSRRTIPVSRATAGW